MTTANLHIPKTRTIPSRFHITSTHLTAGLGVFLVLGVVFTAIFAPQLSPYDPAERVARPFLSPNSDHVLGTNDIGQDILSELIYGARISLLVGVAAGLITVCIGTTVGLVSGYYPRLGSVLMRVTDLILILPFLPLLIIFGLPIGSFVKLVYLPLHKLDDFILQRCHFPVPLEHSLIAGQQHIQADKLPFSYTFRLLDISKRVAFEGSFVAGTHLT